MTIEAGLYLLAEQGIRYVSVHVCSRWHTVARPSSGVLYRCAAILRGCDAESRSEASMEVTLIGEPEIGRYCGNGLAAPHPPARVIEADLQMIRV